MFRIYFCSRDIPDWPQRTIYGIEVQTQWVYMQEHPTSYSRTLASGQIKVSCFQGSYINNFICLGQGGCEEYTVIDFISSPIFRHHSWQCPQTITCLGHQAWFFHIKSNYLNHCTLFDMRLIIFNKEIKVISDLYM